MLCKADQVYLSVSAPDLFEGYVADGLLSGFSINIVFDISVPNLRLQHQFKPRKPLPNTSLSIYYDIWENRLGQLGMGKELYFKDLEELKKWWANGQDVIVASLHQLDSTRTYQIQLTTEISVNDLEQGNTLQNWVDNSRETTEDDPSDQRNTGFVFSVNRFVSALFGSRKESPRVIRFTNQVELNLKQLSCRKQSE